MHMKPNRTGLMLSLISLVLLTMFSACTAGPVGIFASIALETDINASRTAAFDDATPAFAGRLDATYHTIVNRTLWSKPVSGGSWARSTTLPPGVSQGTASSAVVAGTNLFVSFGLIGESTQKVWVTADGANWTDASTGLPAAIRVDSLLSANGQAFAVTRTDTIVDSVTTTAYSLHYWDGSAFASSGSDVTGISGRPSSIAHDGTDYWVTAGAAVYRGTTPDNLAAETANLPSDTFAGVVTDGTTVIFASTSGKLYTYNGSGAWPVSETFEKSEAAYAFTAPVVVGAGGKKYLLLGTEYGDGAASASGYLEFDISAGFTATSASPAEGSDFTDIVNFQTSVSENYLSALVVDPTAPLTPRVFALTVGNGLWSNYYNGTAWTGWARE